MAAEVLLKKNLMDLHFYLENQSENFKLQSEMSICSWDSWR